jgi:hypothetical protein
MRFIFSGELRISYLNCLSLSFLEKRNAKHSSRQLKNIYARDKVTKEIQDKPDRSARFVWPTPPSVWLTLLILAYSMLNDNFEFAFIY